MTVRFATRTRPRYVSSAVAWQANILPGSGPIACWKRKNRSAFDELSPGIIFCAGMCWVKGRASFDSINRIAGGATFRLDHHHDFLPATKPGEIRGDGVVSASL